eukprot:1195549-Amphidinium_carterae.1
MKSTLAWRLGLSYLLVALYELRAASRYCSICSGRAVRKTLPGSKVLLQPSHLRGSKSMTEATGPGSANSDLALGEIRRVADNLPEELQETVVIVEYDIGAQVGVLSCVDSLESLEMLDAVLLWPHLVHIVTAPCDVSESDPHGRTGCVDRAGCLPTGATVGNWNSTVPLKLDLLSLLQPASDWQLQFSTVAARKTGMPVAEGVFSLSP